MGVALGFRVGVMSVGCLVRSAVLGGWGGRVIRRLKRALCWSAVWVAQG